MHVQPAAPWLKSYHYVSRLPLNIMAGILKANKVKTLNIGDKQFLGKKIRHPSSP